MNRSGLLANWVFLILAVAAPLIQAQICYSTLISFLDPICNKTECAQFGRNGQAAESLEVGLRSEEDIPLAPSYIKAVHFADSECATNATELTYYGMQTCVPGAYFIATCNDTYARVVWLYATGCESHASENLFPLNQCHQGPNNDFLIVNCFVTEVPAVPIVESEPLPETTPIQPPNNSPDHAPMLYLMAALALLVAWL